MQLGYAGFGQPPAHRRHQVRGQLANALHVVAQVNLSSGGPHTVNIDVGTYRERLIISAADAGSSEGTRVRFVGSGSSDQTYLVGLGPALSDASAVLCTAANDCDENGSSDTAFANTYKFDLDSMGYSTCGSSVCSITGATQINGNITGASWPTVTIVDPYPNNNGLAFEFLKPVNYTQRTSVAQVAAMQCSWYKTSSSSPLKNHLYVHTCQSNAPSTADVETIVGSPLTVTASGNAYVTFDSMTVAYSSGNGAWVSGADHVSLLNFDCHTVSGTCIIFEDLADYGTLTNGTAQNGYTRGILTDEDSSGIIEADEGWVDHAGGGGVKFGNDNEIICPYCSTLYRFAADLAAGEARPPECVLKDKVA